jgi:hypothetical protein
MELKTYPGSKIALFDARVVALAWASMGLAAVLWFAQLLDLPALAPLLPALIGVFFVAAIVHVVLSLQHACPVCDKHPTVEGFGATHEDSKSQAALSGWAGAVLNILKRRQLVCIHCGTHFTISA